MILRTFERTLAFTIVSMLCRKLESKGNCSLVYILIFGLFISNCSNIGLKALKQRENNPMLVLALLPALGNLQGRILNRFLYGVC